MALDWIKMRTDLNADPRVLRITRITGLSDPDFTVGKLHRVWSYFDEYSIDGTIRCLSAEELDRIVAVNGFAKAMEEVSWLQINDDSLTLPRFDEHNGASAKRRAQDARRKGAERHASFASAPAARGKTVANGDRPVRAGMDNPRTDCRRGAEDSRTEGGHRGDLDERENTRDESSLKRSATGRRARGEKGPSNRYPLSDHAFESLFARIIGVTLEDDRTTLRALYRHYAETMGVPLVERALSATRDRTLNPREKPLRRPGAYFNKTCLAIAKESGVEHDHADAPQRLDGAERIRAEARIRDRRSDDRTRIPANDTQPPQTSADGTGSALEETDREDQPYG